MREKQIVVAAMPIVALHVVGSSATAFGEKLRRVGPRRDHRVEEIWRPSHQAERGVGPDPHGLAAPHQIVARSRNDEREARLGAVLGAVSHPRAEFAVDLKVVEHRHRRHRAAKHRIVGNVAYLSPGDPDIPWM